MASKPVDAAIVMVVGPCIDDTDFKTLEEAIAYNAAGMDISLIVEKTDGTTAVTAITLTTGGTSDWTHKDGGYYEVEITAAQNIEEGVGYLRGVCTGVLPFESAHYDIVKANIYDSLIKGTDKIQADMTQCGGSTVAAGAIPNAAADAAGGLPISDVGGLDIDAIKAKTDNLPSGITKNVALSAFNVFMVLSSDHVTAATGKTITGTVSKDGAAFASLTNAVSEISAGMYKVDLTQAEMNANIVTLKFAEVNCDQRIITIYTN